MKKKHQSIIYLSLIITLGLIISPKIGNCQSFQYIDLDDQYGNFNIQYNDLFNNSSLYNNPILNFQLPNFNNQSTSFTIPYNDFNTQYNSSFNTANQFNPIYNPISNLQLTALIPFSGFNIPFGNFIFNPSMLFNSFNVPFGGFSNWCPYSIPSPWNTQNINPVTIPYLKNQKASQNEFVEVEDGCEILTLDDLYNQRITNLVDKEIYLKTKIKWEYCLEGFPFPVDPVPRKICGRDPTVVFENVEEYIEKEDFLDRGNFTIVSDEFDKVIDSNDKEKLLFNGNTLSNNNKYYIAVGMIRYREWLNVTEDNLSDPKFIEQSNNPVYWTQTFEFELLDILLPQD